MLLVMVPLIGWASFRPDFLATYPTYRPGSAEAFLGVPEAATLGVYQVTYALRYVSIELFFRGFLVLGLERVLGRAVLMPMVTLYAFWHFGKPLPEAAGAIVAAYVLGVFALRSRSIIGGIIVHVGVAVAMEWAAYLQIFVFGR
jgi:membrane protease YdiL (CAAX protease family)